MLSVPLIALAQDKKKDDKDNEEKKEEAKEKAEEKKEEAKDKAEDEADDRDNVVDAPGTDRSQDRRQDRRRDAASDGSTNRVNQEVRYFISLHPSTSAHCSSVSGERVRPSGVPRRRSAIRVSASSPSTQYESGIGLCIFSREEAWMSFYGKRGCGTAGWCPTPTGALCGSRRFPARAERRARNARH